MTRRWNLLALLVGLGLLAAVPAALALTGDEFGDAPPPEPAAAPTLAAEPRPAGQPPAVEARPAGDVPAGPTPPPTTPPSDGGVGHRGGPALPEEVTVRSARVEDLPRVPADPTEVRVEALGITAPLDPVGVDDGVMEIPDDVARAGWYEPGVAPGAGQGSAVISAHVDSRQQGEGAFFPLREAAEGERVKVDTADGETLTYVVVALRRYAKGELPSEELFRRDGAHQLALVTCGGAFDEATRTYAENIVVIAEPA